MLTTAAATDPYAFGNRDIAGLVFIGVAILAIWLVFLHLQGLSERKAAEKSKPPVKLP